MPRLSYAPHLDTSNGTPMIRIMACLLGDWRVSAYSLIIVSFLLILLSSRAHADDLTGLPHDDPKDLTIAAPTSERISSGSMFAPLPGWARGVTMPPLPYQLTPMGKKPVAAVATTSTAKPPLAPPKDSNVPAPVISQSEAAPKPAPASESPAMVTVSPFLQWIKSNPQAAAAAARQQAGTENAPQAPAGVPNPGAQSVNGSDVYWLPPLIDSGEFSTGAVGGSAAIYSTPQR